MQRDAEAASLADVDEIAAINRSIREAAAWCRLRADPARPAESLRTPDLLPSPWPLAFETDRPIEPHQLICVEQRLELVAEVIRRRREGLAHERVVVPLDGPMPRDGFLIVIWPDSDMHDECARDTTEGFFDVEELPGHDSWIAYVTGSREKVVKHGLDPWSRLIAWIPNLFRDRWERAKQESVFDNFDALPIGASAAAALAAARRAVSG
jgi:hypothetical protein